ncbi:MAG: hypothetical protein LBM67_08895 [Lentimicrobiaceae bacterium]|jgi:hypothetical protein|nr:hypothetical protein [Lentimicrobiaceae bacterium]
MRHFFGFFFLLLLFYACKEKSNSVVTVDTALLQEGDLIFRRGVSLSSRTVLVAGKNELYSHVGILVKDSTEWLVIHSVPGETTKEHPEEKIKKETLKEFFAPEKSVSGAIFRLDTTSLISYRAAQKAKELFERELLFDHQYNPEDSTKMYCTELIYFVYQNVGIDVTEGRRKVYPGFQYPFIFPKDITDNQSLRKVFFY